MNLLDVPEDALPSVNVQPLKNTYILYLYFCCRVDKAVTFLLQKAIIVDWVWYWYGFQMRVSVHDHGIMKLKVSPDILDLVSRAYFGITAIEVMQCTVEYHKIPAVKK